MKKSVLTILLAATMLLSQNSGAFAAEETLNVPVQADVPDELGNPEAVSADAAETENPKVTEITELQAAADSENITANFEDPNFQAAIREYLEKYEGLKENDPITKANCEKIANLDVRNKGIKSLVGIEYLTNLFYLDCSNNQLTSLDMSKCSRLATLSCENNQLTSLNVSKCPDLLYLYCQNNRLDNLDLAECTELEQMNCNDNQLTSLDMSKCLKLRILDCNDNQLTSLDISKCTNLEYLGCCKNKLTTLKLDDFPVLDSLVCSDNSLTNIQFKNCPALTFLQCSNNKLNKLLMDKCPALNRLSCSDNELTNLDLSDCSALKYLICNANELTSLNVDGCAVLESLNCEYNQLTSLNVDGCAVLESLNCEYNQLAGLNIECANLTQLHCTCNKLSSLNLSGGERLQVLSCGYNQLTSLELGKCSALDNLSCMDNNLTKLDVSKCANLRYINCSGNYMKSENDVIGKNSHLTGDAFIFNPQKGTITSLPTNTAAPTDTGTPMPTDTETPIPTGSPDVTPVPTDTETPVPLKSQTIAGTEFYSDHYGNDGFMLDTLITEGNGTLSYKSSHTEIVEVSDDGYVTIHGVGTAVITVTASATREYERAEKKITVVIEKGLQKITVASSYTKVYGDKAFVLRASAGSRLSYHSSAKSVATVSAAGKVTIKGCGKAVITITADESSFYQKSVKKVTVTVKPKSMKISSLRSPKKKTARLAWKRDGKVSGYEIQYSQNKKFPSGKTAKIRLKKNSYTNRKIGKLASRKKYYVRIRSYKTVGKSALYGGWSKVKSVKVK